MRDRDIIINHFVTYEKLTKVWGKIKKVLTNINLEFVKQSTSPSITISVSFPNFTRDLGQFFIEIAFIDELEYQFHIALEWVHLVMEIEGVTNIFLLSQQFFQDTRCASIHINYVENIINVDETTSNVMKQLLKFDEMSSDIF